MKYPDPRFEEKLLEVVGLYMKPPENAVVLCVDEKTGIQALDRTQAMLPLRADKLRAWPPRLPVVCVEPGASFAALQKAGRLRGCVVRAHQ